MASTRDPRRMDPTTAEQWQRRRAQETTETKPRRRLDNRTEHPHLQETPILRLNPSRKPISRIPPSDFSPYANGASNADQPFDLEEAPKHLVPDDSPASPTGYEKPEDPLIPRKSASRRRRSTISAPAPGFERSRETGWSTPQVPVRRDVEQNPHQIPILPMSGHFKQQEFRSASPSAFAGTTKHRPERGRPEEAKADRALSPLPKVIFQEDVFLSSTPRQQTDRVRPSDQPGKRAKSRTQDSDARERGIEVNTSLSSTQDGPRPKQPNVLVKKSGRDPRDGSQGVNSYRLAVTEGGRVDDQSFLRRPESIVAPHDSWNRSVPSPPREENRILPPKLHLAPYQRTPELDRTPPTPTAGHRSDGRTDRTPSHRHRQQSEYPLSPPNELDSTPPSSGVAHYATASDFSSDPSGRVGVDEQILKMNPQKQISNNSMINRNRRPSFTSGRASAEDRAQYAKAQNAGIITYSSVERDVCSEQRPYGAPAESSPRLRGVLGGKDTKAQNMQIRSNISVFATRNQSSKPPAASRHAGDARDTSFRSPSTLDFPQPVSRFRSDDSMTYVAVTASGSSPQSEHEDYDDLSEASHYTDHETPDNKDAPSRTNERITSNNIRVSTRRVALLTGLGLSLTNLNGIHPTGESIRTTNRDQEGATRHVGPEEISPDAYRRSARAEYGGMDDENGSPLEDEKFHGGNFPADAHTRSRPDLDDPSHTSQSLAILGAEQTTRGPSSHGVTPVNNTTISSGQSSRSGGRSREGPDVGNNNETRSNINQIAEQVSRGDARRNTWVYDEAKVDSLPTRNEGKDMRRAKPTERRSDSTTIVWSDNDGLEEPLSEDAQRMFDRLQHGDLSQDAPRDNADLKRRYQNPREHDLHFEEPNMRTPNEKEQEAAPSPIPEEIPPVETSGIRTWRRTISSSAYQSLLKKHGIVEMKRQDVIFELCETEAAFVKSMRLVIRLFVDPLRSRGHWLQGLPHGPMHLFQWLDDIVDLHTQVASALHSSRASQFPLMLNFAETFRPFVYRLEVHQPYLVHLEQVAKELDGLVQDSENKYGQFIRSQSLNPECGNMGLASFLLKPMQRLTKYPLFFKQIWELTPRSHPDHLPMFALYNSTNLVIKVMQEVKAREEEFKYIEELASRITGFPQQFQLARRERRLIAQGLLRKVDLLESDKELLDGFNISLDPSRDSSPRIESQYSPTPTPMLPTPPIPELGKLGPVTSPLFPSYHNRTPVVATPPSPYTPRRSHMSAVSRASTALSEASRMSEWTTTYSPTSSLVIPSDFDDVARPDSSASSILSHGHVPFVPYGQPVPSAGMPRRNGPGSVKHGTRGKSPKEAPIYVFVFTDLVVLTSQTEKAGLFQSKQSQTTSERMKLIDEIGISRVLGVINRSGNLDYEYLIQVDLLPMSRQDTSTTSSTPPPTVCSVYLTLPTTGNARLNLKPTEQMKEARDKWISALDRCYGYTLRALTFPFIAIEASQGLRDFGSSSVMALLASGLPLPKSPSHQLGADEAREWDSTMTKEEVAEGPEWWSRKFKDVLREIERIQDTPVMLIGDAALTIGRGLKRVHTADRTRRNGPQQLLLPVASAMSSPSAISGSSQGRRSILGIKRR